MDGVRGGGGLRLGRDAVRRDAGVDVRHRLSGTTEQEVQPELVVGWIGPSTSAAGHGALRFCSL
ncbi:hypothetical protein Psed_6898 (plasmid) [Pseudonocardia dioxanivorans CB1190]|uniref:Uncharacterized protein n=1 Tax=Pseudonocardia dioxanivorans (strain ATCC 55486 / DSM 44775 / JCM 13855 / CB1190) TaxID=675635 RepID=F2L6Z3_PSEUX|nr:hypothetical protein [Pseudonocardia dioxanivorans]AEA28966.1 hypothetical protein Psed_6898 [Pseudonocardia dioxanivorans CB1190]